VSRVPLPSPDNPVKRAIDRRAAQVRNPRKRRRYTAAAYETAPVEANWTNPEGGDADSGGWRQERRSIYGSGVTNLRASVDRFFQELAQHDRGQASYELAADVQRPAAQYRGRYKEQHRNALALLGQGGSRTASTGNASPSAAAPRTRTTTSTEATFDQAGYDQAVRRQKVASLLEHAGRGSSVLFRSGLLSSMPVDATAFQGTQQVTKTVTLPGGRQGRVPAAAARDGTPSNDAIKTAIHAAKNRLGITESGGNNRGPEVDKMERSFGMVGQAWCGIYLGTVLRRAGVKVDSRVASVAEIETMARNKTGGFEGGWHSAKHARAGDALVTRRGQHVAFVKSVDRDGTIHVIGGNQGNGAVTTGTWRPDQVYGVARPKYR
jgi:hypothetical protein